MPSTSTSSSSSDDITVNDSNETNEDIEEALHFRDVLDAFRDYHNWMKLEQLRRDNHLLSLPSYYQKLLPSMIKEFRREGLSRAIQANQYFLNFVAEVQEDADYTESLADKTNPNYDISTSSSSSSSSTIPQPKSSSSHFSKVKSTLHQIVRDWSEEGKPERDATYGVLLKELDRVLPITKENYNTLKVLVPGCGLGRLVYDLITKGYIAQGNEFSYFMLFASHAILNYMPEKEYLTIHPWIHTASNHIRVEDMLRPVTFPDVNPSELLDINPNGDMSMVAGDFLEVYSTPKNMEAWDSVLTCYFIDTAAVVLEYIDLIYRILKPNGVWINTGPLLYHWEEIPINEIRTITSSESSSKTATTKQANNVDERYFRSIELSYSEIRYAMQARGFIIEQENRYDSPYACNRLGLMKTVFTGMTFTARKPGNEKSNMNIDTNNHHQHTEDCKHNH